jgi:transposase, IS5 family
MLRIHILQQWFNLSDLAMFREFAGLEVGEGHLPDESNIRRVRHLLKANGLSL